MAFPLCMPRFLSTPLFALLVLNITSCFSISWAYLKTNSRYIPIKSSTSIFPLSLYLITFKSRQTAWQLDNQNLSGFFLNLGNTAKHFFSEPSVLSSQCFLAWSVTELQVSPCLSVTWWEKGGRGYCCLFVSFFCTFFFSLNIFIF